MFSYSFSLKSYTNIDELMNTSEHLDEHRADTLSAYSRFITVLHENI